MLSLKVMAFPPKKERNRRLLDAWMERPRPSYRKLAKRFRLNSPATVHKIIRRELAKHAA